MTINCKRGGRLVIVGVVLGGERRGEMASSSSLSSSRKDDDVGQREGRRITTTIAGGEVALSLLSRDVGKDLRERVAGGKGGRGKTDDGDRGALIRFVVVVDLDPGSVESPLPRA